MSDQTLDDLDTDDALSDEDLARQVLQEWNKPIPKNWAQDQLVFFKATEHKAEIQALSRGLTMEETLNFYGLTFSALPEYDAVYFVATFLQGRMKAKSDAVTALFQNMRGPQGTQASIAYLQRFAPLFKGEVSAEGGPIKAIKIEVVE